MAVNDTDQIATSLGGVNVQYSVLELKARLGEYAMLAHTLAEALVKEAAKQQPAPETPAGGEADVPADMLAALSEIPLPEDEQVRLLEAFGPRAVDAS